jgi:transposase-like protein
LYRLHYPEQIFVWVTILLSFGCPVQAIVAAFGIDERTVASWLERAGQQARQVQEDILAVHKVDLQHVQADEMYVKVVRGRLWMAMAMAVVSRLWLGGEISPHRDLSLITSLVEKVYRCGRSLPESLFLLVCVDGLSSYVTAFLKVFREKVQTGTRGRPRLRTLDGLLLAQVVKQYTRCRVSEVTHRVVRGSQEAVEGVLKVTRTGHTIHTAYIERLNATFRSRLTALVRRGRALFHQPQRLQAGMYLVGVCYNFCTFHRSLRLPPLQGEPTRWLPGQQRTPAMAAGLTDHCWSMRELLTYKVPPPPLPLLSVSAPKRRGRPPKQQSPPSQTVRPNCRSQPHGA